MEQISDNMEVPKTGNLVSTDDQAHVELLGMREIDDIISDELEYYKGILKEDGISGLLDQLA
ncbi:MAG: hypothetical protein PUB39_01580 [Eubacteriales bacterium]|nr:hypothetical protein [Eubacteriales bacterium]